MKRLDTTKRLTIATIMILGLQMAFASISSIGSEDYKNKTNKYSLKNLGSYSRSYSLSLHSIKSGLSFRGTDILSQRKTTTGALEMNSMLRFERGNTTYIMPYKFKVKVPKFKTPSAVN